MSRAIKIVGACPADLLDRTISQHFAARRGVVLIIDPALQSKHVNSWNGSALSPEQINKLKNTLDFLHRRDAFINFRFQNERDAAETMFDTVLQELKLGYSDMGFAVCSNPPASNENFAQIGLLSAQEAIDAYSFDHGNQDEDESGEKLSVKMEPASLCVAMTQAAFDGTIFKIVDPYIFEMNGRAQKRVDFIISLCKQLDKFNSRHPAEVAIEIYGRAYSTKDGYTPIDEYDVQKALRKTIGLKEVAEKYHIRFVGLKEKQNGKKLHNRYFLNHRFIIRIEDSFETRRNRGGRFQEQDVWFGIMDSHSKIDRRYDPYTQEFIKVFCFDAEDAWE